MTTWNEDYTDTFNALTGVMHGGADRSHLTLTAVILTAFKRLVEYVMTIPVTQSPPAPRSFSNPFDLTDNSRYVDYSEMPGVVPPPK